MMLNMIRQYTVNLAAAWDLPAALAVNRQHNQIKYIIVCRFFGDVCRQ